MPDLLLTLESFMSDIRGGGISETFTVLVFRHKIQSDSCFRLSARRHANELMCLQRLEFAPPVGGLAPMPHVLDILRIPFGNFLLKVEVNL